VWIFLPQHWSDQNEKEEKRKTINKQKKNDKKQIGTERAMQIVLLFYPLHPVNRHVSFSLSRHTHTHTHTQSTRRQLPVCLCCLQLYYLLRK
jgi:hypothetical protein